MAASDPDITETVPPSEEAVLWGRLREPGGQRVRERLFELHAPFAKGMARRHFRDRTSGDLELADLDQYAFEGLLESIDRYDPGRGVPFRAFASRRISGNILDGIIRASELREQLAWSRRMRQERVHSLAHGSKPRGDSALEALTELAVGLALGFMLEDTGMLARAEADGRQAAAAPPHAWQSLAWAEMKDLLARELANLDEREQMILRSHYLHGMAFDQIAALLRISKGRVSQLHRGALATLRKRMASRGHFRLEQ